MWEADSLQRGCSEQTSLSLNCLNGEEIILWIFMQFQPEVKKTSLILSIYPYFTVKAFLMHLKQKQVQTNTFMITVAQNYIMSNYMVR